MRRIANLVTISLLATLCPAMVHRDSFCGPQWKYEVTLTGYPGARWKALTSYVDKPAFGDVTGDGRLEIVATSLFGDVFCVDGTTGSILWAYEDEHSFELAIYICPAIVDVNCDKFPEIISVTPQGKVICLEGRNGRKLWSFKADGPIAFSPSAFDLDRDGVPEIAVSDLSGKVYLLNNRGEQIWKASAETAAYGTPAMGLLNQQPVVITGDRAGVLRCLNGINGQQIWRFSPGSVPFSTSPILFRDSKDRIAPIKVVIGTDAGDIHMIDAARGTLVWSRKVAKRESIGDFALGDLGADGALDLVFSTSGSRVVAMRIDNSAILWHRKFEIPVKEYLDASERKKLGRDVLTGEPVLADLTGNGRLDIIVEVRGLNNYIYGLGGADGRVLWRYGTKNLFLNPALSESTVLATYQEASPLSSLSATVPVFSQPTPVIADFDGDGKADLIINDRDEIGLINTPLPVSLAPGTWAKYVSNSCNNTVNFSEPCLGAAAPPSIRLTVDPLEIDGSGSARLCWTGTAGASIRIDQGIGSVGHEGCVNVSPTSSTRWQAVANNCGGEAQTSVALVVKIKQPAIPAAEQTPDAGIPVRPIVPSAGPKSEAWTLEDVFFEYDWYRLTREATTTLERNIKILQLHPQARVALEATCDERGAVIYNRYLAIARAESVRECLVSRGIEESRLEIKPQGETTKWNPQRNDAGWALNRRVHFVILP